ncbi:ABC transporter substrate-binding protein [Paenibacillus sp. UMB4589-SE434]|uniref:AraC family transcriptional regulator n=1 Tax=Paenibacillus sp. UMB4589-SE434 TaxID=3046314 RepID=UPI00254AFCD0|nr:ABC transporter substrate-binding protein [Paenibacillus sp. UMB4589-SE434]MDK8179630.1 ABC transporter substrate-binding protein [Paenibacillus sp. UMB4589-SE434]
MNLNDLIQLWNHASMKVMDVRHYTVRPRKESYTYPLPTSVFLYAVRGDAQVQVQHIHYTVRSVQLIHGGKGLTLDLLVTDSEFEYYLIYYKAVLALPCRQDIVGLLERSNVFQLPYTFTPQEPISLLYLADKLLKTWNSAEMDALRPFHARTIFHQFVCELLQQMNGQHDSYVKPDLVMQAKRYIYDHYAEPITLEALAAALNYSIPYLSKQFKLSTGQSPIDYLIDVRLNKAQELLSQTDATVQEVAVGVGYMDLSYFIRAFKKHAGCTPGQYKEHRHRKRGSSDNPMTRLRSVLVPSLHPNYNTFISENDYQLVEGEKEQMLKQGTRWKIPMLMLGIALFLGACSGTTNVISGSNGSNSTQSAQQTTEASTQKNESVTQQWPRTYKDGAGRDVVINSEPKKIVVTHFGMMEYFFALDTPPIASTLADRMLSSFETLKPYANMKVKDIGEVTTPDLEMMAELGPDLIVAFAGTHNDVYEDLSKISPVVMINNADWDWSETLRQYAQLIGKEQLAEDYITKLQSLMKETKTKLSTIQDKTVTFLRPTGDGNTFYVLDDSTVNYVYDQANGLGMKTPGTYKLEGDVVSLEGITLLDPDYIFIVDHVEDFDAHMTELNKSKVWKSLKAAKGNHVFPLDVSISTQGPLAIEHTTKQLIRFLTK